MISPATPAHHSITTVSNLLAFTGTRPPSVVTLRDLDKAVSELERAHPKGIGYVHAIFPDGARQGLEPDLRDAFLTLIRQHAPMMRAAVVVVAVGGFTGATLRAVVTGVILASGVKVPIKVVSNIDESAAWFIQTMKLRGADVPSEVDVRKVLELGRKELGV
jgi:hypothetical protein